MIKTMALSLILGVFALGFAGLSPDKTCCGEKSKAVCGKTCNANCCKTGKCDPQKCKECCKVDKNGKSCCPKTK